MKETLTSEKLKAFVNLIRLMSKVKKIIYAIHTKSAMIGLQGISSFSME